jgi:hypothetical protein
MHPDKNPNHQELGKNARARLLIADTLSRDHNFALSLRHNLLLQLPRKWRQSATRTRCSLMLRSEQRKPRTSLPTTQSILLLFLL